LEKILLEYEQCHCSKVNKKVTITSMVIKESNEEATPDGDNKQAFDCNRKENCGVLTGKRTATACTLWVTRRLIGVA